MSSTEGEVVMVVEDSEDDRRLLELALAEVGPPVSMTMFERGDEALQSLTTDARENRPLPGLILLDLNLPGMDGREVLTAIRKNPSLASIPVAMLTTSAARSDAAECYERGCSAYFVKPYGVSDLASLLQAVVGHWLHDGFVPPPRSSACWLGRAREGSGSEGAR